MENVHVDLTPFTSVPATSKIGLINEKAKVISLLIDLEPAI